MAHPDTKATFSFGGSDSLAADITGGAPADVFASAGPKTAPTAHLTTAAAAELDLHPGATVWAMVKATQTHAYPA